MAAGSQAVQEHSSTTLSPATLRVEAPTTTAGRSTVSHRIDGETGYVVPPGCPQAFREALDKLYYNPRQATAMGAAARQRYLKLFTGELMGARYAETYRQVLLQENARQGMLPETAGRG